MPQGNIAFKIDPEEYEIWKEIARKNGLSLAGFIKMCVREKMEIPIVSFSGMDAEKKFEEL